MIFKFLKHMVSATVARDFAQQCKTEGHGVLRRARRDDASNGLRQFLRNSAKPKGTEYCDGPGGIWTLDLLVSLMKPHHCFSLPTEGDRGNRMSARSSELAPI